MGIHLSSVVAHLFLRVDDVLIALRIDHQSDAHGLHCLVDPRVGEDVTLMASMRFTAVRLARFNEVVDTAVSAIGSDIGALAIVDAMRNPVNDESLGARIPEWAVNRVLRGVDHVQAILRRSGLCMDVDRRGHLFSIARARQFQDIVSRC